ncbi:MAG: BON domain-containing protein [Methylotenera sp.]
MNNVYKLKTLTLVTSLAIGITAMNVMAAETYDTDTYTDTSWQTPEAAEFSKLDTSGNGLVMPYEAMRGKAFNSKTFAKADADHDGTIDQREYIYYKTGAWPVAAPTNTTQTSPLQPTPSQPEAVETETPENMAVGEKRSVGEVIDDSVITAKSKAAILRTENLKTLQISVETRQGEVTLSGVVDNAAAKMKAEEVVRSVDGVTSVKNNLEIRT